MECLYCGDCCLRMSPFNGKCHHIKQKGDFYFCGCYNKRPQECIDHRFDSKYCPVGVTKLNLDFIESIHQRIDTGYAMLILGYAMLRSDNICPLDAYRKLKNQ